MCWTLPVALHYLLDVRKCDLISLYTPWRISWRVRILKTVEDLSFWERCSDKISLLRVVKLEAIVAVDVVWDVPRQKVQELSEFGWSIGVAQILIFNTFLLQVSQLAILFEKELFQLFVAETETEDRSFRKKVCNA